MWCSFRHIDQASKLCFSFRLEVAPGQRRYSVLEQSLIEALILLLRDILLVPDPERLVLVHSLELLLPGGFRNRTIYRVLNLLLIDLFSFFLPLLGHFLNFCFDFGLGFFDLFLMGDLVHQIDRIVDKPRVPLDKLLELLELTILGSVLLQMKPDNRPSLQLHRVVLFDIKGISGSRGPLVLPIAIVLGNDFDLGADQEWRVKSHTELPNQVNISLFQGLHEAGGATIGHSTQIVDKIVLGHTNSVVDYF